MNYPSDWDPALSKKPICGVLSCAVIAGVTFERATQAIKNNLLPHQKRHGGRTYDQQRVGALRELGVNFIESIPEKMTLQRWIATYARPGVTYAVTTTRHVVTVRDGTVIDQYEIAHYLNQNSRRCFVRHVLEIV